MPKSYNPASVGCKVFHVNKIVALFQKSRRNKTKQNTKFHYRLLSLLVPCYDSWQVGLVYLNFTKETTRENNEIKIHQTLGHIYGVVLWKIPIDFCFSVHNGNQVMHGPGTRQV